ncbi:MAG: hypothetical protein ACXQS2_01315, partial [Methermicoccaceae archaeon]
MKVKQHFLVLIVLVGTSLFIGCTEEGTGEISPPEELTTSNITSSVSEVVSEGIKEAKEWKDLLFTTSNIASSISEAMDYTNPTTRNYALSLIDKSSGGEYNVAQICDIWEATYNDWTYVNDPAGLEYFSKASETINNGLKGDCD